MIRLLFVADGDGSDAPPSPTDARSDLRSIDSIAAQNDGRTVWDETAPVFKLDGKAPPAEDATSLLQSDTDGRSSADVPPVAPTDGLLPLEDAAAVVYLDAKAPPDALPDTNPTDLRHWHGIAPHKEDRAGPHYGLRGQNQQSRLG